MTISVVKNQYSASSSPAITPNTAPAAGSTVVLLSINPKSATHTTPSGWESSRINHDSTETGIAAQVMLWKNGANSGELTISLSANASGSLQALTSDDRQVVAGSIKTAQGPWNTYNTTVLPSQTPTAASSTACCAYSPSYYHRDAKSPTATKIATTVKNDAGSVVLAEGQPSVVTFRKELTGTAPSTADQVWAFGAYDPSEPTAYTSSGDERWMVHGWLFQAGVVGITGGGSIAYLPRPTALAITGGTLTWSYTGNEQQRVYSSASSDVDGTWTAVATLPAGTREYFVSPSATTYYTVVAVSGDVESAFALSSVVSAGSGSSAGVVATLHTSGPISTATTTISLPEVPDNGFALLTVNFANTSATPPTIDTLTGGAWTTNQNFIHPSPVNDTNAAARMAQFRLTGPVAAQSVVLTLSAAAIGAYDVIKVTGAAFDSSTSNSGASYLTSQSSPAGTAASDGSIAIAHVGTNTYKRSITPSGATALGNTYIQDGPSLGSAKKSVAAGAVTGVTFAFDAPNDVAGDDEQSLGITTIFGPQAGSTAVEVPTSLALSGVTLSWAYSGSGDGFQVQKSLDGISWSNEGPALGSAIRSATIAVPSVSTYYSVVATRSSDSDSSTRALPIVRYYVAPPPPPPPPAPVTYGSDDVAPVDQQRQSIVKRQAGAT